MRMRWNRLSAAGLIATPVIVFLGVASVGIAGLAIGQTPAQTKPTPTTPTSGPPPGFDRMKARPPVPTHPAGVMPPASSAASAVVPGSDIVHFTSRMGSFKLLGSDVTPVGGTLDMKFDGTVLVSALEKGSSLTTTGTIRMEKETPDHVKKVYFGKGEMIVKGKLRALQFFGKDVTGTFKGVGIFRLFGEFDNHLETGFIWYDGLEKHPWGTGGNQIVCPNPQATVNNATVRVHPAG